MDAKFVLQYVPNADPSFVRVIAAVAISGHLAMKVAEVLPSLHKLFLEKRAAFREGAWDRFHETIEKEAKLIASFAVEA